MSPLFGQSERSRGVIGALLQRCCTSESEIVLIFLVMNLKKVLRDLFVAFFGRLLDELKSVFSEYYHLYFASSAAA